jgi:hypothetical protein
VLKVTARKPYRLSRAEQETVIRASAADQEWDVFTADPRFIGYLKRQGYEPGPDHQSKDAVSCKMRIARKDSQMTVEQRASLAIRLKSMPRNRAGETVKS